MKQEMPAAARAAQAAPRVRAVRAVQAAQVDRVKLALQAVEAAPSLAAAAAVHQAVRIGAISSCKCMPWAPAGPTDGTIVKSCVNTHYP